MKHERKNPRMRAPSKQPICGLWSDARCCDIRLDTRDNTQQFRNLLLENNVIQRGGNWVGGTTDAERERICAFLGYDASLEFDDVMHKKGPCNTITVKKLLCNPAFFTTQQKYMLIVDQHALYVQTNKMKRKLWVADQRGKPMRIVRKKQNRPDTALVSMLNRHVLSVWAVRQKKRID